MIRYELCFHSSKYLNINLSSYMDIAFSYCVLAESLSQKQTDVRQSGRSILLVKVVFYFFYDTDPSMIWELKLKQRVEGLGLTETFIEKWKSQSQAEIVLYFWKVTVSTPAVCLPFHLLLFFRLCHLVRPQVQPLLFLLLSSLPTVKRMKEKTLWIVIVMTVNKLICCVCVLSVFVYKPNQYMSRTVWHVFVP